VISGLRAISIFSILVSLTWSCCTYAQEIDEKALEQMRKRYESSFESIYVTDPVLNNLAVHLRTTHSIALLTKNGADAGILNIFRKFLTDVANDRAFLQLELRTLKAGFKRQSDPSPGIQQLSWSRNQVYRIAVICDRYLQGQIELADLQNKLAKGDISIVASWNALEKFRRDPYVPAATMTGSLNTFLAYINQNQAKVSALAATNPSIYERIANFKTNVNDPSLTSPGRVRIDWPVAVKSEWDAKYKLLESYGKSTNANSVEPWLQQLDHLQNIEYEKLIGSVPSPKIDWRKPAASVLSPKDNIESKVRSAVRADKIR
jgi:hypothetical protein